MDFNCTARKLDSNKDGFIDKTEVKFDRFSRAISDKNNDGKVSVKELAQSLRNQDIFIGPDKTARINADRVIFPGEVKPVGPKPSIWEPVKNFIA